MLTALLAAHEQQCTALGRNYSWSGSWPDRIQLALDAMDVKLAAAPRFALPMLSVGWSYDIIQHAANCLLTAQHAAKQVLEDRLQTLMEEDDFAVIFYSGLRESAITALAALHGHPAGRSNPPVTEVTP